ncbi:sensor histidine kinase [Plantibacter sp. YIM 135249]|uniref:sensor histidine kinase n=1 Tax=Plantibacter sp. YIM 135249 TaxID=3423918 RepID=UPI003D330FBB
MAHERSIGGFVRAHRVGLATVCCALLGFLGAAAGLRIQWNRGFESPPLAVGFVVLAVFVAIHLFRQRRPQTMLLAGAAVVLVEGLTTGSSSLATIIFLADLLYAAALYSPARWIDVAGIVLGGVGILLSLGFSVVWGDAIVGAAAATLPLLCATSVWWGRAVRSPRLEAERERARADTIERAADALRNDAIIQERLGISRDLHDVIAGHLSAIAMQSSASLERSSTDVERLRRSMEAIRLSSVEALADMRVMIDVLRADGHDSVAGATDPGAPGSLTDLDRALEVARANGLHVEVDAPPVDQLAALPAVPSTIGYRIVVECLTNVAKHAPGARTELTITADGSDLGILVVNAMPPSGRTGVRGAVRGTGGEVRRSGGDARSTVMGVDAVKTSLSGGVGLVGLAERARIAGGTLSSGATDGRWSVCASIPMADGRKQSPSGSTRNRTEPDQAEASR